MKILGIETSCDDTGIAILSAQNESTSGYKIFSNVVASQIKIHKKYGGVYPTMAKREHQRNLVPTLIQALKQAKLLKFSNFQFPISNEFSVSKFPNVKNILEREVELTKKIIPFLKKYKKPDLDLIAITDGPGLEPCLWVGVNFAKALSYYWDIPIVAINHIESHILVNFLNANPAPCVRDRSHKKMLKNYFPAVCLVVSGGHTQLILMRKIGDYKIIGETRDDAAGECFDKCAKILGLGYPGGPIIATLATKSEIQNPLRPRSEASPKYEKNLKLPRPMISTKDYDFSFSGLKTAVLYAVKKIKQSSTVDQSTVLSKKYRNEMAAEIQQAIIDVLIKKTIKAAKDYRAKTIILGGGVSANQELRKQFIKNCKLKVENCNFLVPPENLSTDNALMTAIAGYFHRKEIKNWSKIEANANLRIS